MKIVFLTRLFYPDIGGVEKHVLEIGKRMVKDGHKVLVITESKGEGREVMEGVEIRRVRTPSNWFKKFYIWIWLLRSRKYIREADIIHAHDVYYWYFPLRFIYPGKKSFITFHGYESYPIKKRAIMVRKISEKLSNGNIIVGDFIKKWYGTKPNFVIYGGVDSPAKYVKPGTKDSALFIGRLDEQTGIMDYANAVDLITEKIKDFKFTIIGDGEFTQRLSRYRPLGFKPNPEAYFKSHNFAFVSRYLTVLEALANQRLVFALYDNPVKEDYLKMSPFSRFIVIENNSERLAEKVLEYLRNDDMSKKMVEEGYKWVKTQTWDGVVDKYYRLWGLTSLK